jgi:dienelactone hydrolase
MAEMKRYVNLYDVLQNWLVTRKPDCLFEGRTPEEVRAWQRVFRRRYLSHLTPWPERVAPKLEVVSVVDKGDHLRKKVLFNSCAGVTVPAYLLEPKGIGRGEKRPGILAAHGHGNGKDDVVGATREGGDPDRLKNLDRLKYEYGAEAVRRGYVVIAPDWCPFGERRPAVEWTRPHRDACNVMDLAWRYFGRPLLTQNIWDGMRAVDALAAHPKVDARRLGVIGLSQGGTMTTHLLINDRRLRAGVVSGYISTVRGDALGPRGRGNTCGAQHVPGLLLHGDIPEMLGLACPKPVLFEMGEKENCFHYPDMIAAYRRLERIYKAAGHPERIEKDVHPNDHQWSGEKAWAWLERWL